MDKSEALFRCVLLFIIIIYLYFFYLLISSNANKIHIHGVQYKGIVHLSQGTNNNITHDFL